MAKVKVFDQTGAPISDMELKDEIFDAEINEDAVHLVVRNYLASKRLGTQSAKTRAEVRGGGRKPWRQKGTGHARQGSRTAPNWRGGGMVFAVKPRKYGFKVPRKIHRLAMKSVLTSKRQDGDLIILDKLALDQYSTKEAKRVLSQLGAGKKAYLVLDKTDDHIDRSFRNLEGVDTVEVQRMNVYDVLNHQTLVVTQGAVKELEEVLA